MRLLKGVKFMTKLIKLAKITSAGLIASGILLSQSLVAFAETDRPKCENVKSRIDAHIIKYNNVRRLHVHRKEVVAQKGDKIVEIAKKKGADTIELEAALLEMQEKLTAIIEKYDELIAKLEDISDNACDYATPDALKEDIDEAKTLAASIKERIQEAKEYWRSTVKPLFQDLVSQRVER